MPGPRWRLCSLNLLTPVLIAPAPVHCAWREWLLLATLTAVLTAVSTYQSLTRYEELRSGWSWDLAYYNQWFWALTHGDGVLTVRPLASYAQEGPSIWKMNYLAPIRLLLVPFYRLYPDPRILIVIQNVMFWWVVPAAYTLVRSESRSEALALSAACLVPLTPLFWPLVWNDFRELQLAGPFVLWAVQGVRSRSVALAALGIAGMLACRQEFAVMVATFAFLPARDPEALGVTLRWRHVILLVGLSGCFSASSAPEIRGRPRRPRGLHRAVPGTQSVTEMTWETSLETLLLGMGAWALLALPGAPGRDPGLPWIWGPCSGRWAMRLLSQRSGTTSGTSCPWPALVLAAGLIGLCPAGETGCCPARRPSLADPGLDRGGLDERGGTDARSPG